MTTYAFASNADGTVRAIKYQSAPDALPVGQIECTQEQYDNAAAYRIENGVIVVASAADQLSAARSAQIAVINAACQGALKSITVKYPDDEVTTWDQQLVEAQAYSASASTPTPLLSAIAAASGRTLADLVEAVLAASAAYKTAVGAVIGRRQALTAQINAAKTVEAVQAITW